MLESNAKLSIFCFKTGVFETPQEPTVTYYLSARFNSPDGSPTFNNITFRKPSSPLLYQWRDVKQENFYYEGNNTPCAETSCFCIHTIKVKLQEVSVTSSISNI